MKFALPDDFSLGSGTFVGDWQNPFNYQMYLHSDIAFTMPITFGCLCSAEAPDKDMGSSYGGTRYARINNLMLWRYNNYGLGLQNQSFTYQSQPWVDDWHRSTDHDSGGLGTAPEGGGV